MSAPSKLYFVLGPSGVGKTMLTEAASIEYPQIRYVSLDELIKMENETLFNHDGSKWAEFWIIAKKVIESLEAQKPKIAETVLCDVGAGCYKTEAGVRYFEEKENIILIWDYPNKIFEQVKRRQESPWRCKLMDEFIYSECSAEKWGKIKAITEKTGLQFNVDENNGIDAKKDFMKFAESKLLNKKR